MVARSAVTPSPPLTPHPPLADLNGPRQAHGSFVPETAALLHYLRSASPAPHSPFRLARTLAGAVLSPLPLCTFFPPARPTRAEIVDRTAGH